MSKEPIFPSQCKCGHIFIEKYKWDKPQNNKGLIGFCWCGFCRTRENIYQEKSTTSKDDA